MTLPDLKQINAATGTVTFADRHGTVLARTGRGNQRVTPVKLDEVAPVMQQATVAAEDRNFWHEGSLDLRALFRAVVVDTISRRPDQGASTITQQLAKLAFLNPHKTARRKVQEAMLAQKLSTTYSKAQILEMYLNLVYYGHGAYGIAQASRVYFGKAAGDLDLRQASLLAGLVDAPSVNDPFRNPDSAFRRQHYVLAGMVATGAVSAKEAAAADPLPRDPTVAYDHQQALLNDLKQGRPVAVGPAPHFVDYATGELQRILSNDPSVLNQNVTVTTSLDLATQEGADRAVKNGVPNIGGGANNGALLMMDAHNGQILAMVGSRDYGDASIGGEYNIATATRRPGSSFKPYVYAAAFMDKRLGPYSTLHDTYTESQSLGGVKDFDNHFLGAMSASRALVLSRNVPAEEAMVDVGIPEVIHLAHDMGIRSPLSPDVSTAIGSSSVSMIEHVSAYSAFANRGITVSAAAILKVVAGDGKVLYQAPTSSSRPVLRAGVACDVTTILRGYPGQWGLKFRQPTAGKSGTTDSFVDAWYMAYTPDWVVATWAGHTEGGNQREFPMTDIYGVDTASEVTVPFVNTLPPAKGTFSCRADGYSPSAPSPPLPVPTYSAPPATAAPLPAPSPTPSIQANPSPAATAVASPVTSPVAAPSPPPPAPSPASSPSPPPR
ncbi:MAG: transglycosylase domain-containing protein [Candidatus Dormibacteria bacterium]